MLLWKKCCFKWSVSLKGFKVCFVTSYWLEQGWQACLFLLFYFFLLFLSQIVDNVTSFQSHLWNRLDIEVQCVLRSLDPFSTPSEVLKVSHSLWHKPMCTYSCGGAEERWKYLLPEVFCWMPSGYCSGGEEVSTSICTSGNYFDHRNNRRSGASHHWNLLFWQSSQEMHPFHKIL